MKCRLLLATLSIAMLSPTAAEAAYSAQPVPRASCVQDRSTAVFDVTSRRADHVRIGRRNRVSGGEVVGPQPTSFRRGTRSRALRVQFTSATVAWRLGGRVARIRRSGTAC